MRQHAWIAASALVVASCTTASPPPMSAADGACPAMSLVLERRGSYARELERFLDDVRASDCAYRDYRVDVAGSDLTALSGDVSTRNEVRAVVRGYQAERGVEWRSRGGRRDPSVPDFHFRVTFTAA